MSGWIAFVMLIAAQSSPTSEMTQERLNAMADACHAPRKWIELRGKEVVFKADPTADYAKIECMLRKISAVMPSASISFVANAQASEKY